jgi:hypothetical protein
MRNVTEEEFDLVRSKTDPEVNEKIDRSTEEAVRSFANKSRADISVRIDQLDREWDIERWLEMNASALAFTGVFLGITKSKKWFALSATVLPFLFWHAIKGWCPPIPFLRRLGIRTRKEIDREKFALKAIRGDFRDVSEKTGELDRALLALQAARI